VQEFLYSGKGIICLSLAGIFALCLIIQLFYYLFFYLRLAFHKPKISNTDYFPVSVVICARDEAENLEKFLPSVLEQDYPDFEVVVVNDCSEDETEDVLKRMTYKYPKLRFTTIKKDEKFVHGKKLALTIGIKSALHEVIIFTDADCYVSGNQWIKETVQTYSPSTEIVLGYGGYEKRKGLLNKFIRFDTFFIGLQFLAFAKAGIPYMGVGRNMSYKKSLFFKNKGFASHARLDSGDDDLFVNETATKKNTAVVLSPNSITWSVPKTKFSSWVRQKRRHRTTFTRYRFSHRFLLAAEPLSRVFFYMSGISLAVLGFFPIYLLIAFLVRLLTLLLVYYFAGQRLQEKDLFLYSPLFDIVFILTGLIIVFSRKHRNLYAWR
jgi:glycosyltransferase involved in cell wall biosynthesis